VPVSPSLTRQAARLRTADCDLDEFRRLTDQRTDLADYPLAADVIDNVLVYDAAPLRSGDEDEVAAELVRALTEGPGAVAIRRAFPDTAVVDRATRVFDQVIADERAAGGEAGDHFAKAGANDRVWNALEKLAVRDPETFVDYYANDIVALVSRAWLGPGYQVTSQVNVVRPGGQAQEPHRDYHLGFLDNDSVERYPTQVHALSPVLTLQGAVAHSDMPVESGPTMYLPYSHQFLPGYLAWRLPEFREHFAHNYVQLPLAKGDAVFFNPALFHGAGTNASADIQRVANLLQVSSAFGRAMESVDRDLVTLSIYPVLLDRKSAGLDATALRNAVAAAAEGYPFPTNLDLDQPVGGLTPASQAEIVQGALDANTTPAGLEALLDDYATRRTTQPH
jgi:ectoine hydroxylase-related dioxygenase (phytanoyl-CoA dioxygenase family)